MAGEGVSRSSGGAQALAGVDGPLVLALDTYEVFAALDAWLRTEFLLQLDTSTRVVLAGREPPVAQWLVSPEWQGPSARSIWGR